MGPQDGRTLFMFCYSNPLCFKTTRGLVASNFLAFLSDFVFLAFFVFLVAILVLLSSSSYLTGHLFNEVETYRSAGHRAQKHALWARRTVEHYSLPSRLNLYFVHKRLGSFQLLRFLE